MNANQNTKRILIFLALSFGIPWAAALGFSLFGMLEKSPVQTVTIVNYIFISSPLIANIATRLITREGWGNLWLKPKFKRGWKFILASWWLPLLATIVGAICFYLVFPRSFDSSLSGVSKMMDNSGVSAATSPWVFLFNTTLSIMFISVPINIIFAMGEEFGWRAYLLQKLMTHFTKTAGVEGAQVRDISGTPGVLDGFHTAQVRKAALLTGLIHGIWHFPLLLMTSSITPGVFALSLLVYLIFTTSLSILLSWGTLKGGSVWPAAVGHAATSSTSGLPAYLLVGQANPIMGPDPSGLIGGIGYLILALVLLFIRKGKPRTAAERPEGIATNA